MLFLFCATSYLYSPKNTLHIIIYINICPHFTLCIYNSMILSRPLRDVKHDAPCRLTCETDSCLYGCRSSECGNKKIKKCPIRPAPHALRLMIRNLSGRRLPPPAWLGTAPGTALHLPPLSRNVHFGVPNHAIFRKSAFFLNFFLKIFCRVAGLL